MSTLHPRTSDPASNSSSSSLAGTRVLSLLAADVDLVLLAAATGGPYAP